MYFVLIAGIISAAAWARATAANFRTSLLLSVIWGWIAWAALIAASISSKPGSMYVAIALTGCAGISVLGARWPGALAWQFVVFGLGAAALLPFAEAAVRDVPLQLSPLRWAFAIGLLALVTLNYLPTRHAIPAMLVAVACGSAILHLVGSQEQLANSVRLFGIGSAATAPAMAWLLSLNGRRNRSPSNRLWLDFRDRFGAIWSLRVMEQFNRSAANCGSATTLKWTGINGPDGPDTYERLCALLKRFGMPPT